MLHLPGPVPDTQAAALPALVLPGPLHGGPGGLRQAAGQVSGVSGRAQDPVQRDPGLPDQLHPHKVPRTSCRYNRLDRENIVTD